MSIRSDYKSVSQRQRRQSARHQGFVIMALVVVGLFGGLLAYIRSGRQSVPPVAATAAPITPVTPNHPAPTVAVAQPAPEPPKPKYDFYTELPKRQVDVQREEPSAAPAH